MNVPFVVLLLKIAMELCDGGAANDLYQSTIHLSRYSSLFCTCLPKPKQHTSLGEASARIADQMDHTPVALRSRLPPQESVSTP